MYGRTLTVAKEIIRICCDRNLLKEYLGERERDVEKIMSILSVKILGQQEVYLLDKATQDKIATVIAALEDKIELNNRENRKLCA